jgi:hypothetical protein
VNDDDKTVAAMDVLAPGIGEIIGGSQREERLNVGSRGPTSAVNGFGQDFTAKRECRLKIYSYPPVISQLTY